MKKCSKCGVRQPNSNYYTAKGTRDGLRGECKSCFAARAKAHYETNRKSEIARVKQWQQENKERVRTAQRRRRTKPEAKRRERASHLKRKFGITLEHYEEMLAEQEGGCAICGREPGKISLHIDHDHSTGRIRGLLCFCCNNALGDFKDNGDWLVSAANYLGPAAKEPALVKRLQELSHHV